MDPAERARASVRRKLLEQFVALVLDTRASKDEILEMYLNDMPLGQRGSFAIFGVAEAARLFFGKDVSNVTLAEAATMAGVLQSPSALSPFNNPERCRERRNVVLQAMADAGFIDGETADAARRSRWSSCSGRSRPRRRTSSTTSTQTLDEDYPGLTTTTRPGRRRLHDARSAPAAAGAGCRPRRPDERGRAALAAPAQRTRRGGADRGRSANRRDPRHGRRPFVQPVAVQPRRRGAASAGLGLQAVRVPRGVRAAAEAGRTDITPASMVDDSPTTWEFDDQVWSPENYEQEYDGPITFRRALALSRNIATIKVAERAGYDRVAALWKKIGVGSAPKAYPSIALGVFEATPLEIATAYTMFPNMGVVRPLRHILRIERGRRTSRGSRAASRRGRAARHDVSSSRT